MLFTIMVLSLLRHYCCELITETILKDQNIIINIFINPAHRNDTQTVGLDNGSASADSSNSCPNDQLCMVSRSEWQAREPKDTLTKQELPVHRIIISHTATTTCMSQRECTLRLQIIQSFHMDSLNFNDIGYNFLVGGDGRVYVGRGWSSIGMHTRGYNTDSLGIAFVGTFTVSEPSQQQLQAAKLLIEEAVRRKAVAPDYRLYGARQLSSSESPGEALYNIIKTWAHWTNAV